jgi:hypothetical protein
MKTLSEKLVSLLLIGLKQSGFRESLDPLSSIEESLTPNESHELQAFLKWAHTNQRTIGHGNIQDVYKDFLNFPNGNCQDIAIRNTAEHRRCATGIH